jgi:hypothetical protein
VESEKKRKENKKKVKAKTRKILSFARKGIEGIIKPLPLKTQI